jgi:hypothetical protein
MKKARKKMTTIQISKNYFMGIVMKSGNSGCYPPAGAGWFWLGS